MAYFAKLGTGNIVEQVISINNSVIIDANKIEQEQLGNDFINKLYNTRDVWKQTSYNSKIRKNYAGIGYTYDEGRDAFIAPKPFNSWVLDETTCQWKAPVDYPTDNKRYTWNEETLAWDVINDN
jgi:hypothetical protein